MYTEYSLAFRCDVHTKSFNDSWVILVNRRIHKLLRDVEIVMVFRLSPSIKLARFVLSRLVFLEDITDHGTPESECSDGKDGGKCIGQCHRNSIVAVDERDKKILKDRMIVESRMALILS